MIFRHLTIEFSEETISTKSETWRRRDMLFFILRIYVKNDVQDMSIIYWSKGEIFLENETLYKVTYPKYNNEALSLEALAYLKRTERS